MATPDKLSETQIGEAVASLDGWQLRHGKLHREFKFKNFVVAWGSRAGRSREFGAHYWECVHLDQKGDRRNGG